MPVEIWDAVDQDYIRHLIINRAQPISQKNCNLKITKIQIREEIVLYVFYYNQIIHINILKNNYFLNNKQNSNYSLINEKIKGNCSL
jgi:hypothetical protein